MERRGFFGLLAAFFAVPRVLSADKPDTYGYLTPEIVEALGYDNSSACVFFDGVDVTSLPKPFGTILSCDDRVGFIEVLAKDWNGNCRRDPMDPWKLATERRYGHVRVTMQRLGSAPMLLWGEPARPR